MTARLLHGSRGLVVGVSSERSVGFALATALAAQGAEVAATYRPARRDRCAPLLEEAGIMLHAPLEASDEDSIATAVAQVGKTWGRIDFVVHTCMHVPDGLLGRPLLELAPDAFQTVLGAGVYSLVALLRHAEPWLARSAHPRVVTLTSPSAARATPSYHIAGIAKAALGATILYLAAELGGRGILCNAVAFSLVDTDGARAAVGDAQIAPTRAHLARRALTRRAADASDVAGAVAFLVSPACRNLTGETLTVDGGHARSYF